MSHFLQQILATHTSPTLCGLKPSNLINIKYYDSIYDELEQLKKEYPRINFYILKEDKNHLLILVYRIKVFEANLKKEDNLLFLKNLGYDTSTVSNMLICLKNRLNNESFPHEIGIFLGYDLFDIISFINGNKCLYTGYWKVYSNLDEKLELFNKYTKCKNVVTKMINNGYPIEMFMK